MQPLLRLAQIVGGAPRDNFFAVLDEVPQDHSSTYGGHCKLVYAVDASGHYQGAQSDGWEPEAFATQLAVAELQAQEAEALAAWQRGEQSPLKLTSNEILQIPFYELRQQLAALPDNRQYLLYCDRGTMSRLHAGHLRAEGRDNIKVYAPGA